MGGWPSEDIILDDANFVVLFQLWMVHVIEMLLRNVWKVVLKVQI